LNKLLVGCEKDRNPARMKAAILLAESGVEDLYSHDLRAAYCTNLALTGASTKVIQNLIGHKDSRSTDTHIRFETLFALSEW
jgi:site-specific recombinase XerD